MNGQLKISGTDAEEVKAAAKAVVCANTGKYDPAFDQGIEILGVLRVHTATLHRMVNLGGKKK